MKKNVKKRCIIVISVILFLLCVPIKYIYKDGGSIAYKAILWSYIDWSREKEFDGKPSTELKIFPFNFILD